MAVAIILAASLTPLVINTSSIVRLAENGAVVADGLSGEGTRSWSVQKTGEYTLTHTTYTNGIAGKVETATFVVPGPELTFEYDGGPFVGGKVTINGNLGGWTIYYTLDGSTPTTESLKYTGPFTLSSAANLKAYAVSDSGMSTPLIENNYAVVERARIENVRARQRWPWNGKVDIDFNVVGSAGVSYGVVLSVTDPRQMQPHASYPQWCGRMPPPRGERPAISKRQNRFWG